MILSLFLGTLISVILFLPTFFTIKNRGLNYLYLKKMKCKIFSFKKKKKLFLLDENSLQSQPLFWTVIALPLVVGVMLWAAIAHEYELEWSTSAYSRLMKNAQFPFVILALSPILGAFVMYGHRSLQTFTQINATNKQIKTASEQLREVQNKNKIDIYFSKRKFINEQLGLFITSGNEKINQPVSLYNRAFYLNNNYEDEINKEFFEGLNKLICDLGQDFLCVKDHFSEKYSKDKYDPNDIKLEKFSKRIHEIKKKLWINYTAFKIIEFREGNKEYTDKEKIVFELNREIEGAYHMIGSISFWPNSMFVIGSINIISNYVYLLLISVQEVVLILSMSNDIDALLPDFNKTLSLVKPIDSMDSIDNGDKLAAENLNSPE